MINKNIISLGFVSFFTDLASAMVTSILPIFIVYVLHQGVDKLGFVVAVAAFVSYGFRVLFGILSDRLQIVKPFVVAGYFISAVTKPLLALSNSWQSVAALRGLERMGKAVRSAPKDSLISEYSGGKSGKSFGFHKMMDVAGEMSGAIIAFGVLYFLGKNKAVFRELFAWTLLPGLISVIIAAFFVKDAPYKAKRKEKFQLQEDKKLLPLLFIYFAFTFFIFNDSFFIIKAKESGIDIIYIPLFMVLYNFVQTISSYFFGMQIDRFSPKRVLLFAFLIGILAMASLLFNAAILSFILLALYTVASLNAIRAYISNEAKNRATVYGVLYGGVAAFSALGATVTGIIWQTFNQRTAIEFSLIGLIVIFVIFPVITRKKHLFKKSKKC